MAMQTDVDRLREKMNLWSTRFLDDPHNSVSRQIWSMTWDHAVYRLLLKARELAPCMEDGSPQVNPLVGEFIDRSFWNSQILATRRLVDASGICGNRGVCSLRALISDLMDHQYLLTRGNIFEVQGMEYDLEVARRKTYTRCAETRGTGSTCKIPDEISPTTIGILHGKIDMLAGVCACKRSPSDTVRLEVLEGLQKKVNDACAEIVVVANKFVGHAATQESRALADAESIDLELRDLAHAHEVLCRTAKSLSSFVFNRGLYLAPVGCDLPPLFAHLDMPLAMPENVAGLHDTWKAFLESADAWQEWYVADLCP